MKGKEFEIKVAELLAQAKSDTASDWSVKYLGKKGFFNQLAADIRQVDDKKAAGVALNRLKKELEALQASKAQTVKATTAEKVDLTLPPADLPVGHLHPISQATERIVEIFRSPSLRVAVGGAAAAGRDRSRCPPRRVPIGLPFRRAGSESECRGDQCDLPKFHGILPCQAFCASGSVWTLPGSNCSLNFTYSCMTMFPSFER